MEFNGYHYSQIVLGKDWSEKLDWAKENFENVLEPMGFKGSHYSQIVTNAGWSEKLDWLIKNYKKIYKKGFNQPKIAKILKGKGWEEKVEWIEKHYDPLKYNPQDTMKTLIKKDWKKRLNYKI